MSNTNNATHTTGPAPRRSGLPPRAVVVTRPTILEQLLASHGTLAQARFFLDSRGQSLGPAQEQQRVQDEAVHAVVGAIPLSWRRARVTRAELDRFLFEPDDVVIAVGQDGLVANVAKYLQGQAVIGVNPSKDLYDGVLVRVAPSEAAKMLGAVVDGAPCEERTMVEARCSDGQRLLALNEIFIGHQRHQSARYELHVGDQSERHSSSGIIVCSGTGATGWAKSIARQRAACVRLPTPAERSLAFLVREPWPSVVTGANINDGRIDDGVAFEVISAMNEGGVIFGDGIESDAVEFPFGTRVKVAAAPQPLRLLCP